MASVISFWSNGKEHPGKTSAISAIATYMAIEHNYKTLIVSTGYKDDTLNKCFFGEKKTVKKSLGLFGPNTNDELGNGAKGAARAMNSNKLTMENISNYTKAVFKDRLEVLDSINSNEKEYKDLQKYFVDIINIANQAYDLVFVDLSRDLNDDIKNTILENSNLVVATIGQGINSINDYMYKREEMPILNSRKTLILIGRYDNYSKYTVKNITRYMRERNKVIALPYNTLFFEASQEAEVVDLFLRLRKISSDDRNALFMEEVKRASDSIIYRLQDLKIRM